MVGGDSSAALSNAPFPRSGISPTERLLIRRNIFRGHWIYFRKDVLYARA